jgi:adenine-specific DNA-methyltransferase
MQTLTPADPETKSADILAQNVEQLRALFPEAFTEGKIDFEVLKQLLGATVDEREEKYGLNWHGKRRARQLALTPSAGTLRPCPEDSVDWDTTQNLMIEGDNLEVLKLLQKSYAGKVKLIYIDPPYNTGKDFVYPDNFQDNIRNYLELTGQVEGGRRISSNTEASGRFHTDWLNMMYPRLKLARNLLREDGLLLVSIDDHEMCALRILLDEVFGAENFISTFVWKRKAGGGDDSQHVAAEHEYVLCFARDDGKAGIASILHESPAMTAKYNRSENGRRYYQERLDKTSLTYSASMDFEIGCPDGTLIKPPQPNPQTPTTIWRWSKSTVRDRRDELIFERDKKTGEWRIYTRTWESLDGVTPRSLLVDAEHGRNRDGTQDLADILGPKVFTNPKPLKLLRHLLNIASGDKDSLVLDFFAGSATTAHALWDLNVVDGGQRRFIIVQVPEPSGRDDYPSVSEITKERLRRAGRKIKDENPLFPGDLGFRVFKLDSSNIRAWDPSAGTLADTLEQHQEHLKAGRTEADILHELLLKLGLDLCVPIEKRSIAGKDVHAIGGGVLLACLVTEITRDQVEALAQGIVAWHQELAPAGDTTCVFRDSAFADDVAKSNLAAILNQHGLTTVRSL